MIFATQVFIRSYPKPCLNTLEQFNNKPCAAPTIEYDEYCGLVEVISFGYELCRSDGNEAWLFQDIANGMDSSYLNHLTLIDNQIIMIADDVAEGGQIYVGILIQLVCHSIQSQDCQPLGLMVASASDTWHTIADSN